MKLATFLGMKNLTAKAFAVRIGCPPSTISRLLVSERVPGLLLLIRIMEATEGAVTPNDFVDDFRAAALASTRQSPRQGGLMEASQ